MISQLNISSQQAAGLGPYGQAALGRGGGAGYPGGAAPPGLRTVRCDQRSGGNTINLGISSNGIFKWILLGERRALFAAIRGE